MGGVKFVLDSHALKQGEKNEIRHADQLRSLDETDWSSFIVLRHDGVAVALGSRRPSRRPCLCPCLCLCLCVLLLLLRWVGYEEQPDSTN